MSRTLVRRALTGEYHQNVFLISFNRRVMHGGGSPTGDAAPGWVEPSDLPVFLHEYWHYLQNTTTIAGFYSFGLGQQLLAVFSRAGLNPATGEVSGSAVLDEDERVSAETILQMHRAHEGDEHPAGVQPGDDFEVTGVRLDKAEFHMPAWASHIPLPYVVVDVRTTAGARDNMLLGTLAVEESIAYLVECAAATRLGQPIPGAPPFPYRVVERVFEHIVGETFESHRASVLILASAALLVPHPGESIIRLFREYKAEFIATREQHRAREQVLVEQFRRFEQARLLILDDLSSHHVAHAGRGLMEVASAHVLGAIRSGLEKRRSDPLFELRGLIDDSSLDAVWSLVQEFPPPVVRQPFETPEVGGLTDELLDFGGSAEVAQAMQVLAAQRHYVWVHADGASFLVRATTDLGDVEVACPFRGVCPQEKGDPRCQKAPWRHIEDQVTCWYGAGVSSTLGRVKHTRVV